MDLQTARLIITDFTMDMVRDVHLNSLDEDNRRFVPDEVFETIEEAEETVSFLMSVYSSDSGPLVHPILLHDGTNIGYVQAIPMDDGSWEIGYHIAKKHTGKGYAKEAVSAFLPAVMTQLHISQIKGICLKDNVASVKVMEGCGFKKIFEGIGPYQGAEREICGFVYDL